MKTISRFFLIPLISVGMFLGTANIADAATAKKKVTVSSKKPVQVTHFKAKPKRAALASARRAPLARKVSAPEPTEAAGDDSPGVKSSAVAVIDQTTGNVLYEKNASAVVPIASITKLMTAMVALDAQPSLSDVLTISSEDLDMLKGTHSRLSVGTQLTREEMLRLALMSSENRASSALSRHYPGGRTAFVAAMNTKAQELGLTDTRFQDPTGLTPNNVSSARDLVKMVDAAHRYPLIREFSTTDEHQLVVNGRPQTFRNTNALVKSDNWTIGLSKTGYISEAGKCLVMQAWLNNKPTIIVLLDSWGKFTRIGDAQRIKRWVESFAGRGLPLRG